MQIIFQIDSMYTRRLEKARRCPKQRAKTLTQKTKIGHGVKNHCDVIKRRYECWRWLSKKCQTLNVRNTLPRMWGVGQVQSLVVHVSISSSTPDVDELEIQIKSEVKHLVISNTSRPVAWLYIIVWRRTWSRSYSAPSAKLSIIVELNVN